VILRKLGDRDRSIVVNGAVHQHRNV